MKRQRSLKGRKVSDDDKSAEFLQVDNAFAAAMDEALRDEGDQSAAHDIFESIQNHDDAIAAEIEETLNKQARSKKRGSFTSGLTASLHGRKKPTDEMGLPTVTELSEKGRSSKSSSRPSIFKLSSVPAALGKKWMSDRSQGSNSSGGERSVLSESHVDRPIPTRRLSRSKPSTWDIKPGGGDTDSSRVSRGRGGGGGGGASVYSSSADDSSLISIFDRKAERRQSESSRSGGGGGGGGLSSISIGSMSRRDHHLPTSTTHSLKSVSLSNRSSSILSSQQALGSSTRPSMINQISQRTDLSSDSYVVPMPTMHFETRRGTLVRVALAILFFSASLTFTILLGQGQVGQSVTYYLYNNFIVVEDERVMSNMPNSDEDAPNGAHLFPTIERLESIHVPNAKGDPDYHIPQVWNEDGSIEISIGLEPHSMTEEHYIELIWLKDVNQDKIVLAKEFRPNEESPPTLKAKVPHGVTLQPYTFCNLHLLWKGEPFPVA